MIYGLIIIYLRVFKEMYVILLHANDEFEFNDLPTAPTYKIGG
jgi:hypothetical protein